MLQEICNVISNKSQNEKDAVLSIFTSILVDGQAYNSDKEYQNTVKILLGVNYKKYLLKTKNSFLENIFSLKNSAGKTHKIITILWIKFKIKRKPKNHA